MAVVDDLSLSGCTVLQVVERMNKEVVEVDELLKDREEAYTTIHGLNSGETPAAMVALYRCWSVCVCVPYWS
jgi:hypothetical protein